MQRHTVVTRYSEYKIFLQFVPTLLPVASEDIKQDVLYCTFNTWAGLAKW